MASTAQVIDLQTIDNELNQFLMAGRMLEALAMFYATDCEFQDGMARPRLGLQSQFDHLSGFLSSLRAFNSATLHAQAVGEDTTITEWTFSMIGPEGPIVWDKILRRRWKGGQVISERCYTAV